MATKEFKAAADCQDEAINRLRLAEVYWAQAINEVQLEALSSELMHEVAQASALLLRFAKHTLGEDARAAERWLNTMGLGAMVAAGVCEVAS